MNDLIIIRKAVGRNAEIGQFYNVINEEIPGKSIFDYFNLISIAQCNAY